jgi:threonine dehydrogenase-like Zn-dependent dehydrogenase
MARTTFVYGGLLDKIPMGSAINRGLTFRMAQTPVQHYLPQLLERIEKGEIDPSFDHPSGDPRGRA